jgi:hypothetical protein
MNCYGFIYLIVGLILGYILSRYIEMKMEGFTASSSCPLGEDCPNKIDLSKYVLKSDVPPMPDMSLYVPKSSIPRCPPCINMGVPPPKIAACPPCERPRPQIIREYIEKPCPACPVVSQRCPQPTVKYEVSYDNPLNRVRPILTSLKDF